MESKGSRTGEICPKLLDLIPSKGRERIMRGDHEGRSFGVSEEKKLELKLGPPGEEDWFMNENQTRETFQQSPLSLGCFSSMASQNPNSPFNGNLTPWCSTSSQSPSLSSFQATQQQQQQLKHSFLGFPSIPQNLPVLAKESSQICNKKLLELQNSEKKACSPASTTANTVVNNTSNNSSQKRTAPAPVVGWPPIRSFRKNLANSSSSKPVPESQNGAPSKDSTTTIVKPETCTRKGLFVKINMDGVPIGRKVDLKAYDSYEKLSSAVDELFRGLLSAQRDSSANLNCKHVDEVSEITGILDGSGEYTLVYEDNEGDRMLVGDVPWDMFASTVKRLRVLKSSELSTLHLGSTKQGKTLVTGVQ